MADGDTEKDAEGDDLSLEDVTSMLEERVGRRRDTYFTMHANRVVQRYDELVALKPEERSARVAAAQERLLLEGWSSDWLEWLDDYMDMVDPCIRDKVCRTLCVGI